MKLHLCPVTLATAKDFIAEHHRHADPPVGWIFGIGIADDAGALRGVATVGRPVARHLDDGTTVEVNRCCTDGVPNGPSKLYGAAWRAAKALGYRRLITYTLASESRISPTAAGATIVAELPARAGWNAPGRPRPALETDGQAKIRWEWK